MQPYQGGPPRGGYGAPQPHQPPSAFGYTTADRGYLPFQAHCPRCSSASLTKPSFTWWGGLIGPRLFNHTVCGGCSFGYNAKTGRSNRTAIAIYLALGAALAIALVVMRLAL